MKIEKFLTGEKIILYIGHIECEFPTKKMTYQVWGPESEGCEYYEVIGVGEDLQELMEKHNMGMEQVYAACMCDKDATYPLGVKGRKIYHRRVNGRLTGETLTRERFLPLGSYADAINM